MAVRFQMPATPPRSARDVIASLPAYVAVDATHEGLGIICIEPGMSGYRPFDIPPKSLELADFIVQRWGADRAPTEAEREAAYAGSMFGWEVPGADPLNYKPDTRTEFEKRDDFLATRDVPAGYDDGPDPITDYTQSVNCHENSGDWG